MTGSIDKSSTIRIVALAVLMALAVVGPLAARAADDEVDHLALAAVLIGDGHYERARNTLAAVDPAEDDIDAMRYHTLDGLIALHLEELDRAVEAFGQALSAGDPPDVIHLYRAQALFGLERYREVLTAIDEARAETVHLPSVFLMRAQCHWHLGEFDRAWQVLVEGGQRFPDQGGEFTRRQVLLLVDQGLFQQAAELGRARLSGGGADVEDAIAMGQALREAGRHDEALAVLEAARLGAPGDVRLLRVLAHAWLDRGGVLPAADLMREAARLDPELRVEAAELYRRAGRLLQALGLNAEVVDQPRKLKQRLAILIDMGRFRQAAGMAESLERNGLLEDESIRYALAYALFKSGRFDQAQVHLGLIEDAELFRKATELRTAMARCADEPWRCR